ncbi:hypothetical protein WJX72_003107 [[Myrmecia] bisecta]|uniref:Fe2OG dioxygenase domain-containing protein n=1 Tax=[Myrmecia] bisecta TaxID=41462 RepID=A0AAW1PFJ1_9CHLO
MAAGWLHAPSARARFRLAGPEAAFKAFWQQQRSLTRCASAHPDLPGEFLFKEFVSCEEAQALVALADAGPPPWKPSTFNGRHRGKAWGVQMDLGRRIVVAEAVPLPALLQTLAERMRTLPPLRSFYPNEANAIDYRKSLGHHLAPHVDDRKLSTGVIVTLSLLGTCLMTFQRDKGERHGVDVLLPPRALQVLTRDARYAYTHAIQPHNLLSERRISITFRQSPLRSV